MILVITTMKAPSVIIDLDKIPPLTRFIHLSLYSYSTDKTGYCLIDNVQFRVFEGK